MRTDPRDGTALDPAILEQAADWVMRLTEHPVSDSDRLACERWRVQHPDHARAWARAEQLLQLIDTLPPALAHPVLQREPARRTAIKRLAALGVVAPAGWLTWRLWDNAGWDQSLRTATGERRPLRLPDNGRVELDTDTALDVRYASTQRLLRLRSGRIQVDTAADPQAPARPFRVFSTHGRMEALGTRFIVQVHPRHTTLTVLSGAVRVQPAAQASATRRVDAGHSVTVSDHACSPPQPAAAGADDWTRGMFAADARPLSEVIAELSRYRRGVLRCDSDIGSIAVSGAFPLDDSERSLRMLAATYPIAIRSGAGGWWTTIVARHP